MDVLSQAIAVMRTGESRFSRVECLAPWGREYTPSPQPGVHVMLQGSAYLFSPTSEPRKLEAGDVILLPSGHQHAMADTPDTPWLPSQEILDQFAQAYETTSNRVLTMGPDIPLDDPKVTTVMLCGGYQLERARAHPLITELPAIVHLRTSDGRYPALRGVVDLMAAELDRPNVGSDAAISSLLDMLLLYILRAWYTEQPCDESLAGWSAALADPAVSTALASIHDRPEAPWTVESLASEAGLSRAAFARKFTALVGQPPLRYLTWWRMTLAARLLSDLDSPLNTVAGKVGYISEFAFANAFKREFGMSPGRYRSARAA